MLLFLYLHVNTLSSYEYANAVDETFPNHSCVFPLTNKKNPQGDSMAW